MYLDSSSCWLCRIDLVCKSSSTAAFGVIASIASLCDIMGGAKPVMKSAVKSKAKPSPKKNKAKAKSEPQDNTGVSRAQVSGFLTGLKYKEQHGKGEDGTLAQKLLQASTIKCYCLCTYTYYCPLCSPGEHM